MLIPSPLEFVTRQSTDMAQLSSLERRIDTRREWVFDW